MKIIDYDFFNILLEIHAFKARKKLYVGFQDDLALLNLFIFYIFVVKINISNI